MFQRKSDPKTFHVVPPKLKAEDPPGLPATTNASSVPKVTHDDAASVIGKDLSIEGQTITIRCKGLLRVNGNIHADLHCKELLIGEHALIHGSIAADQVTVSGRINGAILGSNVILHSSAQVEGDIHSQSLSIEQGASFDGRSRTVSDPAEVAPQLEAEGETDREPAPDTEDTTDDEIQIPRDSEEFTPTRDFG
ncbi:MAG: polymer-forming cytoskeletal protein [Hyphomicrobium sp.]